MVDRRAFPKEIREILKNSQRSEEIHAGLWLDKYITDQSRDDTQSRRTFVEEVSTLSVPEAYKAFYTRWQKALDDYGARRREAIVQGRMSVGLGAESVLETSICLHRTYGVPYIPGSALKGLAASYTRLYLGGDERWKEEGAYYKVVFGNTDEAGYITFFDALYVPPATGQEHQVLYPDIITVHHAEYYQGKKGAAPLDSDNPTPIPFLSATGTYLVALAAPDMPQPDAWINITFSILEKALAELGIGAKTSSGYGRMKLKLPPAKPAPIPYTRPNIPKFALGSGIAGTVVTPTDELRRRVPEAKAFLAYREFSTKLVLIAVDAEEATDWISGHTKNCLFMREEERERCTVLICQPGAARRRR